MIDLSVIIPTFNARRRAYATVELLTTRLAREDLRAEILLVDDGSRAEERPESGAMSPGTRLIQLDRNSGKGFAVRTALASATGRSRVFTDVDLPYGADSILECHARLAQGETALVYGDRSLPESRILSRLRKRRRLSSVIFRGAVLAIAGLSQADTQCGVKGLRGDVASAILPLLHIDGFAFDVELFRCARDNNLEMSPLAVHLVNGDDSTVRLVRHSASMLKDLVRIRAKSLAGGYSLAGSELPASGRLEA